jgi:hypothetical protein
MQATLRTAVNFSDGACVPARSQAGAPVARTWFSAGVIVLQPAEALDD